MQEAAKHGGGMAVEVGEGVPAPDFSADATVCGRVTTAELLGQPWVLYFYPRDDTPGCTLEASGFRDLQADFEQLGSRVIGVSTDTLAKHEKFAVKHHLAFPLVADVDAIVAQAYGVYVPKNMYGKTSMGIARTTFLVDAEGIVAKVWRKVKPENHAAAVLEAVRALVGA
jgi:peroxiredoxin Q/BCP